MTPTSVPITIVILTWNGLRYTQHCLETLREKTLHSNYRILVVDNGSTDGTVEYLAAQDSVTLIRNASNLGFARANNIGIKCSDATHDIVLLNNDIEIHQADWLSRLQETAYKAVDIGVVGCRLSRPDGTLQHAGTFMPLETFWGQQIGGGERNINQYSDDRDVEGVVFACVYLKRDVLNRVGLLNEDYFCYFEDTDYCFRAARQGYRTVCCGSVTVLHHENVSTKVNGVRHGRYFEKAQNVFRSHWEDYLTANRYTREIGWHSILNFPTGYAISSRELVRALDQKGVRVSYKYVYGPGTVFPREEPEQSHSYLIDLIRRR